jgi:HSP20 family protein
MKMLIRRSDPFRELGLLSRRLELFHSPSSGLGQAANWAPTMDVIEKDDSIVLRAELPGMSEEDIEITVENRHLTIQGEKKFEHEEGEGHYRRLESRYGSFYRTFSLPNTVDQERIDARFAKGVLEIELPKSEQAKPKKISVTVQ